MRKLVPIGIIGILIVSGLGITVSSSDETSTHERVSIIFSTPVIKEQNEYVRIDVKETNGYLVEQKKPMIPSYTHTFYYPKGTEIIDVTCIPENIKTIKISKQVQPSPHALPAHAFNKIDRPQGSYDLSEPYPDRWFTYDVGSGLIDNEKMIIVKVQVLPVNYIPKQGTIEWAEEVDIQISYKESPAPTNTLDTYDLLILTPDEFTSQLQPLIDHKTGRGISTNMATLDEIADGTYFPVQGRDTVEEIKFFIKNAIETWGIQNVLIVGGSDEFPARQTHIDLGDDDEIFVSDLYYADIYNETGGFSSWDSNENDIFAEYDWEGETDEIDFYPDVKIGRLACIDTIQVTTIVDKIIHYENSKSYTKEWFNQIVLIGGDTFPESYGDSSDTNEGERVNQFIHDRMPGFMPDKIWDSNERLSGLVTTGLDNIKNGIEQGCGFIDFSGHGAPWVWTTFPHNGERQSLPTPTGRYTNDIIDQLTNGDMLPIVFNGGCSLGKYQANDNCNSWAFLANPNGGGIASFGATGLGYVYVGQYVTEGLVEGLSINIFEAYNDGASTFGDIYIEGLNTYLGPGLSGHDYKTLTEWHAFGDPTLTIADDSTPPSKPSTPEGPTSGKRRQTYEYVVTSTDVDGDEITYLFDWGDGTYSWAGPYESGAEASVSKTWDTSGDFQIRVSAKDENGKTSPWSNPLQVNMPKQYGNLFSWLLDMLLERLPLLEEYIKLD